MDLRILAVGDIVGKPGREILQQRLPDLIDSEKLDLCIGNAENVAGGSGITPDLAEKLFACGLGVLTSGDHIWRRKEIHELLMRDARVLRPANYPEGVPGRGCCVVQIDKGPVGVVNLQGRTFLPALECPFRTADRLLSVWKGGPKVIVVDFHAEATSDKIALGRYLDGRVSAVVGTHTHVQTADEQILPQGTAYLTDLGMTGPYDSVLGRRVDQVLSKYLTQMSVSLEVADGDPRICGCIVTVDAATGRAREIRRVQIS
jgi:metallophosphoesterase (TIGR00282 family)